VQPIQPSQATRLLNALKEELSQAQNAGQNSAKAKQHYARAEQIKQVLLNYRQQQQRQRATGAGAATASGAETPNGAGNRPQAPPAGQGSSQNTGGVHTQGQLAQAQYPARGMGNATNIGTVGTVGTGGAPAGSTGGAAAPGAARGAATPASAAPAAVLPKTAVTVEKYQDLRKRLLVLEQKIRSLESSRRPDMTPDDANKLNNEIQETRQKYTHYSRYLSYMKTQLVSQAQSGGLGGAGAAASSASMQSTAPLMVPGAVSNTQMDAGTPGQAVATPAVTNALIAASNTNSAQNAAGPPNPPSPVGITGPAGAKDAVVGAGVNLSQVTKPSVPTLPISSSINVKPSTPVFLKPGANNLRPTLTGGSSTSLGQIVASPAITRMPTYEMASGGPMQDNNGRVLTKRKLTELVNSLGADEGDGKTTIDGDVEELLLDLADEFVSSVTSFACRLAKHRKAESVDVKDVQLHLERNWNMRIPGYATEEIRSTRRWQPSAAYNQKIQGVDIVKAVNGNIN
ncbi:hypothetical protein METBISCDRAFT_3645, partial [Metschnikowia bicuspidata]